MNQKIDFTENQLIIMKTTVDTLIDITIDGLKKFMMEDGFHHFVFIENVIKNYVGNMVYNGIKDNDPKEYIKLANIYLEHLRDFFRITADSLPALNKQNEVH